jgi:hypothetical protein
VIEEILWKSNHFVKSPGEGNFWVKNPVNVTAKTQSRRGGRKEGANSSALCVLCVKLGAFAVKPVRAVREVSGFLNLELLRCLAAGFAF